MVLKINFLAGYILQSQKLHVESVPLKGFVQFSDGEFDELQFV